MPPREDRTYARGATRAQVKFPALVPRVELELQALAPAIPEMRDTHLEARRTIRVVAAWLNEGSRLKHSRGTWLGRFVAAAALRAVVKILWAELARDAEKRHD